MLEVDKKYPNALDRFERFLAFVMYAMADRGLQGDHRVLDLRQIHDGQRKRDP